VTPSPSDSQSPSPLSLLAIFASTEKPPLFILWVFLKLGFSPGVFSHLIISFHLPFPFFIPPSPVHSFFLLIFFWTECHSLRFRSLRHFRPQPSLLFLRTVKLSCSLPSVLPFTQFIPPLWLFLLIMSSLSLKFPFPLSSQM